MPGREGNVRDPITAVVHDAIPCLDLGRHERAERTSLFVGSRGLQFSGRERWDRRERVDLTVGVRDGRAHLGTPILEHEHVRNLGARHERRRPLGPQIDDLPDAVHADRRE